MESLFSLLKSIIFNGAMLFYLIFWMVIILSALKILYDVVNILIKRKTLLDLKKTVKEFLYFLLYGITGTEILKDESNKDLKFSALFSTLLHLSIPIGVYIFAKGL